MMKDCLCRFTVEKQSLKKAFNSAPVIVKFEYVKLTKNFPRQEHHHKNLLH